MHVLELPNTSHMQETSMKIKFFKTPSQGYQTPEALNHLFQLLLQEHLHRIILFLLLLSSILKQFSFLSLTSFFLERPFQNFTHLMFRILQWSMGLISHSLWRNGKCFSSSNLEWCRCQQCWLYSLDEYKGKGWCGWLLLTLRQEYRFGIDT